MGSGELGTHYVEIKQVELGCTSLKCMYLYLCKCKIPTVGLWTSYTASVCLHTLICETRTLMLPSF